MLKSLERIIIEKRGELLMTLEIATETNQHDKKRPIIDHLPDALDISGKPLFNVGDCLTIEKNYLSPSGELKWLNTNLYTVKKINFETGNLDLWDINNSQFSMCNFKFGPTKYQMKFKLSGKSRTLEKLCPEKPEPTEHTKSTLRVTRKRKQK